MPDWLKLDIISKHVMKFKKIQLLREAKIIGSNSMVIRIHHFCSQFSYITAGSQIKKKLNRFSHNYPPPYNMHSIFTAIYFNSIVVNLNKEFRRLSKKHPVFESMLFGNYRVKKIWLQRGIVSRLRYVFHINYRQVIGIIGLQSKFGVI